MKKAVEIITSFGYSYTGDCKICRNNYAIYKNPDFPSVEIKVRKADGYMKVFKNEQQLTFAGILNIESKLSDYGLIKSI